MTSAAPNPGTVEVKAFVPAKDFGLSQRFFRDLGSTRASVGGGIAYFHHLNCAVLLQDWYLEAFANNLRIHPLVEDIRPNSTMWRRPTWPAATPRASRRWKISPGRCATSR